MARCWALAACLAGCGGGDEPAPRYEARPLEAGERLVWRSERVLGNGEVAVSTFVQEVTGLVATADGPRAQLIEHDGATDWRRADYVSSLVSTDGGQLHDAQAIAWLPDLEDHDLDFSERYLPALTYKPFPLFVGRRWNTQWAADGGRPAATLEGSVEAEETVHVGGTSVPALRIRTTLVNPRLVDWFLAAASPVREDRVCWWDLRSRRDVECRMQYAYAPATDLRPLQVSATFTRLP